MIKQGHMAALTDMLEDNGIEYVIDEDGIAYCDFYKRTKVSDYKYEIGKIYDAI